jgi:hypothetical protein
LQRQVNKTFGVVNNDSYGESSNLCEKDDVLGQDALRDGK